MSQREDRIAENVARVRHRMAEAARRGGRDPGTIRLVAVVKYVGTDDVRHVAAAGCLDLGESRPQALWAKAAELSDARVRWHMIGHLQRNKARRTAQLTSLIHSGDNLRLLRALDDVGREINRRVAVLMEVNISGDVAKHGFAPDAIERQLPELAALEHLDIRGLMAMAALEGGRERAKRDFAALRELRDRLAIHCPPRISLDELSMGMSQDFEEAIEEGATIVRVGSTLFEGLE